MSLNELKAAASRLSERLDRAAERVEEETKARKEASVKYEHECQAQTIIQGVAQEVQQQAHTRIASVVSRCLTAVFAEPMSFVVRFDRKRGKTEAVLTFVKDKNEISPAFGSAGGELDVAAFALRLACLSLTHPPLRRLLVLDEPFKNVHGDGNRERVRELIETLPKELGVQVIMVTGLDWLVTGKVVKL